MLSDYYYFAIGFWLYVTNRVLFDMLEKPRAQILEFPKRLTK